MKKTALLFFLLLMAFTLLAQTEKNIKQEYAFIYNL